VLCAGALALLSLTQASPARAQATPSTESTHLDVARSIAVSGREAFNAGDYDTALAMFRKAYELYPAPTVVLYQARTLEKMGLLIEASDTYSRTTRISVPNNAPAQFAEAIAAAREEGEALLKRIPTLTVELQGVRPDDPRMSVMLDSRPLDKAQLSHPQRLNPGTYRVVGSVGSKRQFDSQVTLVIGQNRRITINLSVAPDPHGIESGIAPRGTVGEDRGTAHPIPVLAYVAGGVGVAGVGAGVITGLLANGKYDDAERLCQNTRCATGSPGIDAVDAFRTWRMVSSVSYGVGAAGIATGVILWLTGSNDAEGRSRSIEPWGTAKAAGIRGTF
jgi:tetratricopeptide (TPR) repeat protein